MRSSILAAAIVIAIGSSISFSASAQSSGSSSVERDRELAELKAQLQALQTKMVELEERTDAQSDINVGTAESNDVSRETQGKLDKLSKLVNDTQVSGKMFLDLTNINQESHGAKVDGSGTGFDVKRFYLGVNHKFNEVWSANLTTDFQYNSKLDSAANVYVKKAYVQGKFSDALVFRAGAADMPWIPFAEGYYGFRYVENTLTDRLKYGTSSDWGLHAGGDLGDKAFNYAVSTVNGGGYKNMNRSKGMDIEARVGFVPMENMVIAAGIYSGKLGKETQQTNALHTATRNDVMVAYAGKTFRLGGEYFQATNWNNVLTTATDKAAGYSVWGSMAFGANGITGFARYDDADLSKSLDPSLKETYYNLGVEFPIIKGVKVAAVYKNTHRKNATTIDLKTQELGVWGEVSF